MAILDTFDRGNQTGLGTASGGLPWLGAASDFEILANQGRHAPGTATVRRAYLDAGASVGTLADDATLRLDLDLADLAASFYVGLTLSGSDPDNDSLDAILSHTGTTTTLTARLRHNGAMVYETVATIANGTYTHLMLELSAFSPGRTVIVRATDSLGNTPAVALSYSKDEALDLEGYGRPTVAGLINGSYVTPVGFDNLAYVRTVGAKLPGGMAKLDTQSYTPSVSSPPITKGPYYGYPPEQVYPDLKRYTVEGPALSVTSGSITHYDIYYSRFNKVAPMAAFYEPPPFEPPDVEPEAEPRLETFRNRAGIRIEVWDQDAPNDVLLATISRSRNRRWFEALNEPGGGSFEMHLDDPILYDEEILPPDAHGGLLPRETILRYGNIVRCYLDGVARFSFKIENLRVTRVGSAEVADQWVEISGRGVLCLLEDALVYPEYGFTPKSRGDKRLFTFVANEYEGVIDDGSGLGYENFGWSFAKELKAQFDVTTSPWIGSPENWPEIAQNALWIWDKVRGDRTAPAPVGFVYFLKRFALDEEEDLAFFAAADDAFEVYLDGQPLMANGGSFAWRETTRADLKVAAGHHLIAVRCENIVRPYGESPAGFVFAMSALGAVENTVINERATFAHSGTGGTYTLTFNGQTTSALAFNANAGVVTGALEALSTIDPGQVYVTQQRILQRGGIWRNAVSVEFAGPTVRAKDQPDMTWNPAAITGETDEPTATIRQGGVFENAEPAELLLVSDRTWRVLGYPEQLAAARNSPPAFPPGAVMRFLLEEARSRGVQYMDDVVRLHTDYKDNNSRKFDIVVDTAFDIGTNLLQVAQRLAETSVDIYMSPWLELSMWVERGSRRDAVTQVQPDHFGRPGSFAGNADGSSPVETYVELAEGKNLSRASYDDRGIIRNSLLLRTLEGWREELHNFDPATEAQPGETSSLSIYGRREAFLSLGQAPSDEQVSRTVSYAFSLAAQPNSSTVFEVPDTQKGQSESRPYVNFNVGDWIVVPDMHGIRRSRRVVGMGLSEDENGEVYFSVEMTNPRDEYERRLERWLETIQLGTLRGSIASASGVETPVSLGSTVV